MTFLEIVFATALLGLLAATLLGSANFMLSRQKHEQRTLAALELANRLILQFLDDRESMPDPAKGLTYAGDQFGWSLDEAPLEFRPARILQVAEGQNPPRFDNFRVFKVRVWLAAESGGGLEPTAGVPHAEVSRMYDVGLIFRNPDALEYLLSTDAGKRRLMESSTGGQPLVSPRGTPKDGGASPKKP